MESGGDRLRPVGFRHALAGGGRLLCACCARTEREPAGAAISVRREWRVPRRHGGLRSAPGGRSGVCARRAAPGRERRRSVVLYQWLDRRTQGRDADPQEPLREQHARHGGAGHRQGLGVAARGSHVSRGGWDGGLLAGDAGRPQLLHAGVRSGSVSENHRALPGHAHVCGAGHAERHGEPSGVRPL